MNSDLLSSDDLPHGFRFAGVACGIKPSGKRDLAIIAADRPVVAVGVYTQNQVVAAPVVLCRQRTPSSAVRAVVASSGNANACTGEVGLADANTMVEHVAEQLGCSAAEVLVMSTGVIGQHLPMECVLNGIDQACAKLGAGSDSFLAAAHAILTTDDGVKVATRSLNVDGQSFRVAAMAKGAGMIAPNMATLLAVVLTDAPLSQNAAQTLMADACNQSFNRCSVDGHTSTNDTALLLASGAGEPLAGESLQQLSEAVDQACIELAKKLVADGEGASHVIAIHVHGAAEDAAAERIARTVAASPLVKTAIAGGDPNWGRIVSAAGYAEAAIDGPRTSLSILGQPIYLRGAPVEFDASALSEKMKRSREVAIELTVGTGPGEATFWASDLTVDYVKFNSEYTT